MTINRGQRQSPRLSWSWHDDAACRGEDPVLFFGSEGERPAARERRERLARDLCSFCPVRRECLDDAIARNDPNGVWGGLNPEQRKRERRRRMRQHLLAGVSAEVA